MSAGIGRQKELQLDEIVARIRYVEETHGVIELTAAYVVLADVVHDLEKKLAKIVHQLEAR